MDMSASGWSTGCESGWTGYLDESYIPRNDYAAHHSQSYSRMKSVRGDDVEQEDLSMVSDASSGPPHFQENDEFYRSRQNCRTTSKKNEKRSKKSAAREQKLISKHQNPHSYSSNHLDDTASSPAMCYSKTYDDNPSCNQTSVEHYMNYQQQQGISESHFQEHSSYSNHYGFWQSPQDTHYSAEPSHLRGRTWE